MTAQNTFWVMIAREGDTKDGRHISAETLLTLAATYSQDIFCAQVYAGYPRTFGTPVLGSLLAAKTEIENDAVCLYVLLAPTENWFAALSDTALESMAVYPSLEYGQTATLYKDMEHAEPEIPTGRPYIVGVALTTEPAINNLEPLNKFMVRT